MIPETFNISVVIICKNAEATIATTLSSVAEFAEVLLYDTGSTDASLEIASDFANVTVHQGPFEGFGPTKHRAVALAKHEWVLSLDCDEYLSEPLKASIRALQSPDPSTGYRILRENHLLGQAVNTGGWQNDHLLRLFNRNHYQFNQAMVHEGVESLGKAHLTHLKGHIIHQAVLEVGQFLKKIDFYSELRSQDLTKTLPLPWIVLKSFFAFFKSYVLRAGFTSGWRGLLIAWSESNGVFYKYIKKYAKTNP